MEVDPAQAAYPEKPIDNQVLIHQLKKMPDLYEVNLKPFEQHESEWMQILVKMYPDWNSMDDQQKQFRVAEMRKQFDTLKKSAFLPKSRILTKQERQKLKHALDKKDRKSKAEAHEMKALKKKLKTRMQVESLENMAVEGGGGLSVDHYRQLSHKDFAMSLIPLMEKIPSAITTYVFAEVETLVKRYAYAKTEESTDAASTSK